MGNNTAFPGPQGVGEGRWEEERVTRGWGPLSMSSIVCWAREFLSSGPKYSFVTLFLFIYLLGHVDLSRHSSQHADSSCSTWAPESVGSTAVHQGAIAP